MAYTLKIESGDDSREVEFLMKPSFADIDAVLRSFSGQVAKYTDEEGDLCTLTESTFEDFLVTSRRSTNGKQNMLRLQLPALELGERPPSPSPSQCSRISASWTRIDDTLLEEPESLEAVEAIATPICEDDNGMDQSNIFQGVAEGATAAAELADDLTSTGKQSDISAMPPPLHTVPEVSMSKTDPWTSKFTNAFGGLVLTLGSRSAVQEPLSASAPKTAEAADSDDSAASALAGEPNEAVEDSNFSRSSPRPDLVEQGEFDNPADLPRAVLSAAEVTGELNDGCANVANEEVARSQGESQECVPYAPTHPGRQSDISAMLPLSGTVPQVPMSSADPLTPQFTTAFEGLVLTLGSKSAVPEALSEPQTAEAADFSDSAAPVLAVKPKEMSEISNFSKSSPRPAQVEETVSQVVNHADVLKLVLSETEVTGALDAGLAKVDSEEVSPSQAESGEDKNPTFQSLAEVSPAAELADGLTFAGKQSDISAMPPPLHTVPEVPTSNADSWTSRFTNAFGGLVLTLGSRSAVQEPLSAPKTAEAADFGDRAFPHLAEAAQDSNFGKSSPRPAPVEQTVSLVDNPADIPKPLLSETSVTGELDAGLTKVDSEVVIPSQAENGEEKHPSVQGLAEDSPAAQLADDLTPPSRQSDIDAVPHPLDTVVEVPTPQEDLRTFEFASALGGLAGALDPLEANLLGTALPSKADAKDDHASSCKVCCKSLELYLQAPFQRWCCDLCDCSLTRNDPIWACSTAQACDWGVCSDCGDLLRASYSQAPGPTAGEEEDEPKPARNLAEAASPLAGADESAAVTSKEKQACHCKNCSKQLELHMPGPFQRWICDLCDRHFENQDPMWACSSAKNCNWGVCMECYEHAGTDVQDDQTSCRSQAPSSCSSVPVPCMVAGAVGFMLGGPLLGLSWALYRATSLPRNFWEPEDRRRRRRF
eukprot:TRINITY_DN2117_c0_g1_i1.p1 TRINITY_DN2117_c0_g1~~TRINITY_DN2117_c0_g1_i1.p1  ORF type:complete len:937 (-),score=202.20 TRINITY_DN2117_c0_g1_i1:89-2899(-)